MPELVLPLRPAQFQREVTRFRKSHGYAAPFVGSAEQASRASPSPPPRERRIAEVCALLGQPDLPRPSSSFQAYCLVLQLFMTVDSRYFGPYQPQSAWGERCAVYGMQYSIGTDPTSGWNVALLEEVAVLIGARGEVELWQSDSRELMQERNTAGRLAALHGCRALFRDRMHPGRPPHSMQSGRKDYFAELRHYAREETLAEDFRPSGFETKRERVERLFSLFERAPRPGNRLEAHVAINLLLWHVENAVFDARGSAANRGERLTSVLPFRIRASDVFPGAEILLADRHALLLHADGSTDIYPFSVVGEGTVRFMSSRPVATLKGCGAAQVPVPVGAVSQAA